MSTKEQMLADLTARSQRPPMDAAARAAAQERIRARNLQQFDQRHPGAAEWLTTSAARGFTFAHDMLGKIHRGEALSTNMVAAIERGIIRDKERAEQRAADAFRAQELARPVDSVNLGAVEQAFARAKAAGIKWPKLVLDGFKLAPAGANSRNAGAIYVTQGADRDGLYLGRVLGGQFLPSRDCDEATRDGVLQAMADPLASAVAYGKKFGRCAVCMRELSDPESVERGIGPICMERMGWA